MRYIKQNFGRGISRRTYYYYKKSIYENYEKSTLEAHGKHYHDKPMYHDLTRATKGLVTMTMMIERISIIRKGLKMGINLVKHDRPIVDFTSRYTKNMESKTRAVLERSMKLIESIGSKKI